MKIEEFLYLIDVMTPTKISDNSFIQGDYNIGFDEARKRIKKLLLDNYNHLEDLLNN